MKEYNVCYTEVFTGFKTVYANSEDEAINKLKDIIERNELVPSKDYSGHEITVDYAEEV